MNPLQVLGTLFALGMIYFTYLYYRRKELLAKDALVWLFVWLVFAAAVLFPSLFAGVFVPLTFVRFMDMLVVFALMFLFALNFYLYASLRRQQKKIEAIVREIALREEK